MIEAFAFWALHLTLGVVALVLLAVSARAGISVLFAMSCEFFAFFSMFYPGLHFPALFAVFAGVGLLLGALLSIGRHPPESWTLPAVAGSVLFVTQLTDVLIADWSDVRRVLPLQVATLLGPPSGMWVGAALARGLAGARASANARRRRERQNHRV